MNNTVKALVELGLKSAPAREIFEFLATRESATLETSVDTVVKFVRTIERTDIIEHFRTLDSIGVGTFIPGRRGWPSRFFWAYDLTTVGRVGLQMTATIEPMNPDGLHDHREVDARTAAQLMQMGHEAVNLTIMLPANMPRKQAAKLADILQEFSTTK